MKAKRDWQARQRTKALDEAALAANPRISGNKETQTMSRSPSKRVLLVIAASAHGPLIVNRLDYHTAGEHTFGVGIQILRARRIRHRH